MKYDAIVIGSGPAGGAAAYGLQESGKKVAVIESELWGGTCPNYGCDPKKILLSAVEAKYKVKNLMEKGLESVPTINWEDLMQHKKDYTDFVPKNTTAGFDDAGIDYFEGQAEFIGPHELLVSGEVLTADQFLIATGQRSRLLSIEGQDYLQSSRDFLEMSHLPEKIVFLGAGYIAIELATIANAAGSEVHIIHHNDQPLKEFDPELVDDLVQHLTEEGIQFHFNIDIKKIESLNPHFKLSADNFEMTADLIFGATGRIPNIEALNLDKIGLQYTKQGIVVNQYLQTSLPHIYAVGDVIAKKQPKLTPVAGFEANYAVTAMNGNQKPIDYPLIPTIVFGDKRLATIGLSQKELMDNPKEYHSQTIDLSSWYTYRRINEKEAKAKIVYDSSDKIVKISILSSLADEVINDLYFVLEKQISKEEVSHFIFGYPTPASDLEYLI